MQYHLVSDGQRVPVSFPTVCFDEDSRLLPNAVLPRRLWLSNILADIWAFVDELIHGRFTPIKATHLLQKDRWMSFWQQGNFQLCPASRQTSTVDTVVLHWDGCNSSAQTYRVLRQRGLSAHLLIDSDATVYQTLDLKSQTGFHAGRINGNSIGIELCNPVDPTSDDRWGRELVHGVLPNTINKTHRLDFTPSQKTHVCQVLDFLTKEFDIPRNIAVTKQTDEHTKRDQSLEPGFTGVCGHYHVSAYMSDPGLLLWPSLRQHWNM
jgi:N-acetyl-anhydromuramyl-L-alanine amidase AmpD